MEFKEDYDKLKIEQDRAIENSAFNFNKKRGINSEIKQYQEQKAEAERYENLGEDKNTKIVEYLLWKLFHVEKKIDECETEAEDKRVTINTAYSDQVRKRAFVDTFGLLNIHTDFVLRRSPLWMMISRQHEKNLLFSIGNALRKSLALRPWRRTCSTMYVAILWNHGWDIWAFLNTNLLRVIASKWHKHWWENLTFEEKGSANHREPYACCQGFRSSGIDKCAWSCQQPSCH